MSLSAKNENALETSHSLLHRAGLGEETAWRDLVDLYGPWIRWWLDSVSIDPQEVDDLTQDVLAQLVAGLKHFEHNGNAGAFRCWLRTITINRARRFWRNGKCRSSPTGGEEFLQMIEQLEDPSSDLSKRWDKQHDDHIICEILKRVETQFTPQSIQAFRRIVFDKEPANAVAKQLDMSLGAVYGAKSRILQRFRQEADGLIDLEEF